MYFSAELSWQPAVVGPDMVLCCYELYHWQGRGPTPTKVTLSLLVTHVSDATNEKLQQTKHTQILQLHHNIYWTTGLHRITELQRIMNLVNTVFVSFSFEATINNHCWGRNMRIVKFVGIIIIPLICWRMSGWVFCDQSLQTN